MSIANKVTRAKAYRNKHGCGLMEALYAVENGRDLEEKATPAGVTAPGDGPIYEAVSRAADPVAHEAVMAAVREAAAGQDDARDAARWRTLLDQAVDIYFDGIESPPDGGAYESGAFRAHMDECRKLLSTAPASEPVTAKQVGPLVGEGDGNTRIVLNPPPVQKHAPATPQAATWEQELFRLVENWATQSRFVYAKGSWDAIIAHITALREAARQEGYAASRKGMVSLSVDGESIWIEGEGAVPLCRCAQAGSELAGLVAKLQACADDPMWADHAEVSKHTLREVIAALAKNGGAS